MTVALYPGSFDPPTLGHLDVVKAAARLFDHVVVVVAVNPAKTPLFLPEERRDFWMQMCARMPQVRVEMTTGLIVDFAHEISAAVLVRGIRGGDDADAETNLAIANAALAPDISTVLLPARSTSRHVSSSLLKAKAQRGESLAKLCSPQVERALVDAFSEQGRAEQARVQLAPKVTP